METLGLVVAKMQDTKDVIIEKLSLVAESLDVFKQEIYQRLKAIEESKNSRNSSRNNDTHADG